MRVTLNWADYCIIGVLALSVLIGLWRGLIGEVLAIVCWIVAIWVAWHFGPQVAAQFTAVDLPSARLLIGYALCFIAVLIAGAIVGFVLRKLVAGSGLTGTDRLFGMLFGLLRGVVLVTLAVLLLGFTPLPRDPWWHQSQLLPTFEQAARWAATRLPGEVAQYLDWRALIPSNPALLPLPLPSGATPPAGTPPAAKPGAPPAAAPGAPAAPPAPAPPPHRDGQRTLTA